MTRKSGHVTFIRGHSADGKILEPSPPQNSISTTRATKFHLPTLFGSALRTDILTLTAGLGRTYPREIAVLVERPISMVQRGVADLERAGVLVTRLSGRQREVSINSDYIAANELKELLNAIIDRDPRPKRLLATAARRRPRRTGKPL